MTKSKKTFPQTVNGVTYQSQEELDARIHSDLEQLAHLAFDLYKIQKQFDARLEREPQGFIFPAEGRICKICMGGGSGDMWYDKRGMRCMDCQRAYEQKIIPGYVFTDDKNRRHITEVGLVVRYEIERKELRRHVKDGTLVARRIDHGQYPPTIVFLKRENPSLSPDVWRAG